MKIACAIDGAIVYSETVSEQRQRTCADGAVDLQISLPPIPTDAVNITVRTGHFFLSHLAGSPWHLEQKPRSVNYALLHIPKTAGTSLRVALEAALGAERVFPNREYLRLRGGQYLNANEMAFALAGASPAVSLIQGHLSLKEVKKLSPDAKMITVLRRPSERLISNLKHIRNRHGVTDAFEDILSDVGSAAALANKQTRQLSVLELEAPMQEHLESAKEQLATFAVVGLTERYPETLILCEALLGLSLGQPEHLNSGEPSGEPWSTELTERIEALNYYDAELYRCAEQIFECQLQGVAVDS
ncbi:MAG: hypothetical protein ABGY95_01460 [Rubritalea sp.]|uniref:hypothetical protein n=1 Tax=Rubritalea sp. TaxID=2109375 RepID=UPI003241F342